MAGTKVAFWYDRPQEYSGGLNYLRNLLFALAPARAAGRIEPYVFFGLKFDHSVVEEFARLAIVVRSPMLDRGSAPWFIHKVAFKVLGSLAPVARVLRPYDIGIVSHADGLHGRHRPFRIIGWIPDFQYFHLPELFPRVDAARETARIKAIAAESDELIVSSHAALEDLKRVVADAPCCDVSVLQFVSQPAAQDDVAHVRERVAAIVEKHAIEPKFLFLPNQFWRHKNHMLAFRAVARLHASGRQVQLVCTGNLRDYRVAGTGYVEGLVEFLEANGIANHVKLLGNIDYADVLGLFEGCVAVVNPSRFEGWSSTVEEAKSMGKQILLSDIPVHREQAPARASYFGVDDEAALAEAMWRAWESGETFPPAEFRTAAREDLRRRTLAYGNAYEAIVSRLAERTSPVRHRTADRKSGMGES